MVEYVLLATEAVDQEGDNLLDFFSRCLYVSHRYALAAPGFNQFGMLFGLRCIFRS